MTPGEALDTILPTFSRTTGGAKHLEALDLRDKIEGKAIARDPRLAVGLALAEAKIRSSYSYPDPWDVLECSCGAPFLWPMDSATEILPTLCFVHIGAMGVTHRLGRLMKAVEIHGDPLR